MSILLSSLSLLRLIFQFQQFYSVIQIIPYNISEVISLLGSPGYYSRLVIKYKMFIGFTHHQHLSRRLLYMLSLSLPGFNILIRALYMSLLQFGSQNPRCVY